MPTGKNGLRGLINTLHDGWFLIVFIGGLIYWVARMDSSVAEMERMDSRIGALESRTTTLETGIGRLQLKIDDIKEDLAIIKSAVIK